MELFLKGLAAGLIVALPLGPVSVLCIRRVLTGSLLAGLLTVVGAAVADAIYGTIAGFGLGAVSHFLLAHRAPLRAVAGVLLLGFGIAIFRARPAEPGSGDDSEGRLPRAFFSAFLLMLANPTVLLTFLAIFTSIDLGADRDLLYRQPAELGLGVFLGSSSWWGIYKTVSLPFRGKLATKELRAINFVAGAIIGVFGIWEIIDLIRGK